MKKFQFILVDEEKSNISYTGVENKGSRPYLVVKHSIKQGYFLACPLTDVMSPYGTNKTPSKFWISFLFKKESYIKLDQIVIFSNDDLKNNIKLVNKFLDPKLRKIALKKIVEMIKS